MKKRGMKKVMMIIFSCAAALLLLAFITLFLASGFLQPQKYLQPWDKSYAKLHKDPRVHLAAFGLLAANGHNMQPWIIKLDKNDPMTFYLYADPQRMSPQADPLSRQLMVTQGTFLDYVAVAGQKIGYPVTITLFPKGDYNEQQLAQSMSDKPVARVVLKQADPQRSPLFNAVYLPDTNRANYKSDALTKQQVDSLESLNEGEQITTKIYQDKANVRKLGNFAIDGAVIEAGVPRVTKEASDIFRPNEYQKNNYRYGFSFEGQGTSGFSLYFMQGLVTLFPFLNSEKAASDLMIQSTKTSINHTPAYAMISSRDNSRASQVKSGMLYSRLTLTAHNLGLAVQPVSQALEEYPEMSKLYHSIHNTYAPEGQTIQMLVRIGKPTEKVPQSMRRDVMDLISK
ncbi:hypothetical protein ABWW58_12130 [Sporolactobacillus sp. STCC-11]|uniref:Acg family FMN-binding oxidoreductase n=1 Tax=Sporolactobacillus caesalpiniae TaxID=3230362 RepID=UPI0033909C60